MAKRIVLMRPYLSVNDLIRTGLSRKAIDRLKPVPTNGPRRPRRRPTTTASK